MCSWTFEGEVTLIYTLGEILDELGILSHEIEMYADGIFSYINGDEVAWGLAVSFILLKKGTKSQSLLWSHSSTKWQQGKKKSSPTLLNLFVPLKLF